MKILNKMTVLPKRDTLENWKTCNPILGEHELCCILTPRGKCKWKIGDGKTPFKKLRYIRKISDIQEIILYNSRIESETMPIHITTRNTVIYLNPFLYNTENNEDENESENNNTTPNEN